MLQTLATLEDVQKTYDWFEEVRNTQPVWLDESSGCWHVFRYDDVLAVTTDYHLFSSERRRQREVIQAANANDRRPRAGRSMLGMDPPRHRQDRNLGSRAC